MEDQNELLTVAKEYLESDEKVVNTFSPLTYNLLPYNCIITNRRILLFTKDKSKFHEIDHRKVSTLLLRKEWQFGSSYYTCLILGMLGVIFGPTLISWGLIFQLTILWGVGICCVVGGFIGLLLSYKMQSKYYLLMQVGPERFQLHSSRTLLTSLFNEIRQLKSGADGSPHPDTPLSPVIFPSESSNIKYCIHCGAEILAIATFCDKCGKKQK